LSGATGTSPGREGAGPFDRKRRPNGDTDTMGFNEVDKVAQERALGSHLKPESLPNTEVGVELYL
jgi:hypothetical protein